MKNKITFTVTTSRGDTVFGKVGVTLLEAMVFVASELEQGAGVGDVIAVTHDTTGRKVFDACFGINGWSALGLF